MGEAAPSDFSETALDCSVGEEQQQQHPNQEPSEQGEQLQPGPADQHDPIHDSAEEHHVPPWIGTGPPRMRCRQRRRRGGAKSLVVGGELGQIC